MKRLLPLLIMLTIFTASALSVQSQNVGRVKGRVVDTEGTPIPKVQIVIQNSINSFNVTSNEDGYYEIQVPVGSYLINSEKLPGFAATRSAEVRVEPGKTVKVIIVPAVSTEGVLCILYVTDAPIKKKKRRKIRH